MITPPRLFALILSVISTVPDFHQRVSGYNGGPLGRHPVYCSISYRPGVSVFPHGYASALAWVLFVNLIALTLLLFRSGRFFGCLEACDAGSSCGWGGGRRGSRSSRRLLLAALPGAAVFLPYRCSGCVFIAEPSGSVWRIHRCGSNHPRWANYREALTLPAFGRYAVNRDHSPGRHRRDLLFRRSWPTVRRGWPRPARAFFFALLLPHLDLPYPVTMVPLLVIQPASLDRQFPPVDCAAFFARFYIFLLRQFFLTLPPVWRTRPAWTAQTPFRSFAT